MGIQQFNDFFQLLMLHRVSMKDCQVHQIFIQITWIRKLRFNLMKINQFEDDFSKQYSEASIKSTWALIQFLIYWNWALIYVCSEEEKILIQDNLSETLLVLTFTLHIFLWFDIVPGVKPVKLSNVPMLVPLGIRRTGFYFLKMENKLLKGHFWNLSVKIYRDPEPLFGSRPYLAR